MANFEAFLTAWALRSEARVTAVFRDSAQRVYNEARTPVAQGGNMPVVTGNLMRSATVSTGAMPAVNPDAKQRYDNDPDSDATLTITSAQLGETIHIGFQANYAPYMENRYGFVRLTAERWPQIVSESARDIESKVEGR